MGLLLLIPGLVFLLNGTTWFSGEEAVGKVLTIVGAAILVLQLLWVAFVGLRMRRMSRDFDRTFGF